MVDAYVLHDARRNGSKQTNGLDWQSRALDSLLRVGQIQRTIEGIPYRLFRPIQGCSEPFEVGTSKLGPHERGGYQGGQSMGHAKKRTITELGKNNWENRRQDTIQMADITNSPDYDGKWGSGVAPA